MTEHGKRTTQDRALLANRTYKIAFSIAAVLLIVTLTTTVVIIIIASGREENWQADFDTTLTAVYDDWMVTETAIMVAVATQDAGPPLMMGEYPFVVEPNRVQYDAADDCATQVVGGTVLNLDGAPTDAYQVVVWGDFVEPQVVITGEPAGQESGQWSINLSGVSHRRLWVQLVAGGRYYAAPVELVFGAEDCAYNRVTVTFTQVAPLE